MGMFDSFYVRKGNETIEVQTKQLESSMDRFYWGDKVKDEKGITFLVEDYSYSDKGDYSDWFIFVLLNGFYVDVAIVEDKSYIDYTQKTLKNVWSNLELQNYTLTSILDKNYFFNQQKGHLVNSLNRKINYYLNYLDEPTKEKEKGLRFSFNLNPYQDKNVSIKEFLTELKEEIDAKQKLLYNGGLSLSVENFEDDKKLDDVGYMQEVQSYVRHYVYLNQDKFNFKNEEIALSQLLQPLIISSNLDLKQTILFNVDNLNTLPTYFEYLLNYIKLPSELFTSIIHKYWEKFDSNDKASLIYSNFIEGYENELLDLLDKYGDFDLIHLSATVEFWQKGIDRTNFIQKLINKLNNISDSFEFEDNSTLGALIEALPELKLDVSYHDIEENCLSIINLLAHKNKLYLNTNSQKESELWEKAIEWNQQINSIKSLYEKTRLEQTVEISDTDKKKLKL